MIFSRPIAKIVVKASGSSPINLTPPAGAKRALVKLWGGGGGAGGNSNSTFGGDGGGGGFVEAEFKIAGGYTILVGQGGEGGYSIKPGSGINSGKGGGGGRSTMLLDASGKPLLVAAGGGGGGGAMGTNGGNGGAAGFTSGMSGTRGCTGANCPTAGSGATAGTGATSVGASGSPQNPMCSLLPPLTISTKDSSAGITQIEPNPAATGGSAGTCYAGTLDSVGPGGLAFFDSVNAVGCSSGAGGDGRAGGGGGGVAINTSVGCAGGGGGAGYLKTTGFTTFKTRWDDGSGITPGAADDTDLTLGGTSPAGQGGLPSPINKIAGNSGADGLAVIYYY